MCVITYTNQTILCEYFHIPDSYVCIYLGSKLMAYPLLVSIIMYNIIYIDYILTCMQHMYIATYPVGNSPKISTSYLLSNLILV